MENIKLSNGNLPWKLVWDADTSEVLLLKKIDGEFETINELFEDKTKISLYRKINELKLIYNPNILDEEWV